jgi:NTP pyrophosphatase (non-canonical NTP hydrolase)
MPKTTQQKLGYLIEEMGEVAAAVGKTLRWGLGSANPELPLEKREMNGDWILRELHDLQLAINLAHDALCIEMEAIDGNERA